MTKNVSNWIEIFDFRAGIFSTATHVEKASKPNMYAPSGMATIDTYNCFAHPVTGALEPLPYLKSGATLTGDILSADSGPTGADASVIMDAMVLPGRYEWLDSTTRAELSRNDWIWVLEGRYIISGGSSYFVTRGRAYGAHRVEGISSIPTYDWVYHSASTPATTTPASKTPAYLPVPFQSLTYGRSSTTTASCTPGDMRPIVATHVTSKPWSDNTGTISSPFDGFTTFDSDVQSTYPTYISLFPNPATPTTKSTVASALNGYESDKGWMIVHQGRLVHVNNAFRRELGSATDYILTDQLEYTAANKWLVAGSVLLPDEGNPTGYGTGAPFNANSLFLVKHSGGAVSIRGSLDNPQVVKLPAVESTHGWHSKGAMTPMGFVYLTPTGVWSYQDNTDASKLLSLQIEGKAFDPHATATFANGANLQHWGWKGSLAYWHPFIAAPNNWLFDVRTQSWWRIYNPAPPTGKARPVAHWIASPSSDKIYAFPCYRDTNLNDSLFLYAEWSSLSPFYEWWSHNVTPARHGLLMQPTEVELHVTANPGQTGTITATVTIRGHHEDGTAQTDTTSYSILSTNAGRPMILKSSINASANRYASMSIGIGFTNTDTTPAPSITGIRVGYIEHSDLPYADTPDPDH